MQSIADTYPSWLSEKHIDVREIYTYSKHKLFLQANKVSFTGSCNCKKNIWDAGYRILDTVYGVRDTGYGILDTGYGIPDT